MRHIYQTLYHMSVAFEMGDWLTISGATNSGVPYLQYWTSSGLISTALPKSQILIWSLWGSAIRTFSGWKRKKGFLSLKAKGRFSKMMTMKSCQTVYLYVQVYDVLMMKVTQAFKQLSDAWSYLWHKKEIVPSSTDNLKRNNLNRIIQNYKVAALKQITYIRLQNGRFPGKSIKQLLMTSVNMN